MSEILRKIYYRITVFKDGYKYKDKFALLAGTFLRVVSKRLSERYMPEVIVRNSSGLFYCRSHSSDLWVVSDRTEPDLARCLDKLNSGIFVDIGAHIGKYTIRVAKNIGSSGHVIAIEADPENYETLVRNIKLNNLENVSAINMACWDKKEDLCLYMRSMEKKAESSVVISAVNSRVIKVQSDTLDNILDNLGIHFVDVVKIDVECAEEKVLAGMDKIISSNKSIEIFFEVFDESYLNRCKEVLYNYGLKVIGSPSSLIRATYSSMP